MSFKTRYFAIYVHPNTFKVTEQLFYRQILRKEEEKTQMQLKLTSSREISLASKQHTTIHSSNRDPEAPLSAPNPSILSPPTKSNHSEEETQRFFYEPDQNQNLKISSSHQQTKIKPKSSQNDEPQNKKSNLYATIHIKNRFFGLKLLSFVAESRKESGFL